MSLNNLYQFILIPLVSGILASLIAIYFWEKWHKPRLGIEILPKTPENLSVANPDYKNMAFYRLKVINQGKRAAFNCKINLEFQDNNRNKKFDPIKAKWDRTPEPIIYFPSPDKPVPITQPSIINSTELLNINPYSSEELFCVLVKEDGHEECYAFGPLSYFDTDRLKKQEWELSKGEYYLKVTINYSDGKLMEDFYIKNHDTQKDSIEIKKCC